MTETVSLPLAVHVCPPLVTEEIKTSMEARFPGLEISELMAGMPWPRSIESERQYLVVYPSQSTMVVSALMRDDPVQTAMDDWTQMVDSLLALPPQSVILVEDLVISEASGDARFLAERLNTGLAAPVSGEKVADECLFRQIAKVVVAGLPPFSSRSDELNARSFHVTHGDANATDVDSLVRTMSQLRVADKAVTEELRNLLSDKQRELDQLRYDFTNKVTEIERKAANVTSVQKVKDTEIARLKGQVRKFETSTSWRITAPLRRLIVAARSLKGKKR